MNNFLSTVNNVITDGKKSGILHLNVGDEHLSGNLLEINNKQLVNFSSCSYLGLEFDERLKEAAIRAVEGYGTQFSTSRAYLSSRHYSVLEDKFNQIFDAHCVVAPTTTLGHIAAIPVVVSDNDAVILDHQVHNSVHTAAALLKPKGIHVELIRHNRMDMLEERIAELSRKHDKVWYMADGIYSMYGDGTPVAEIYALMDKYEKFHFYVDDAHGMSCFGKHGRGFVLQHHRIHPKMVLAISLAKAFATGGAVLVFPNQSMADFVRTCGGPMITSGPMQPSALGAAIASADIHLSDEIYGIQQELHENIKYANLLVKKAGLPLVKDLNSPVFFIGVTLPKIAYQLIKEMMNDGYYTNLGAFPAVPMKNTGVRFTITRLNTFAQIEGMVNSMTKHFDRILEQHHYSREQIFKTFKLEPHTVSSDSKPVPAHAVKSKLLCERYDTIAQIDRNLWNSMFEGRGSFDYEGLAFLEKNFSGNSMPENNWKFDYLIVRDAVSNKVVLSTFFTTALCKDDMLSHHAVSEKIEQIRQTDDPYFLTSRVLMMGSLLTEGSHLYTDHSNPLLGSAMLEMYKHTTELMKKNQASTIMLRDFEDNSEAMDKLMLENGFFKAHMPERNVISHMQWSNESEFMATLSANERRHYRKQISRFSRLFEVEKITHPGKEQIKHWIQMYYQIKSGNYKLNTFDLPEKLFGNVAGSPNWDVISLKLNGREVAVVFSYRSGNAYSAMFIGIDRTGNEEFSIYRQALYQVVKRASELNCNEVNLGFSANIEKKKLGARTVKTVTYVQNEDLFNASVIESIQISKNQPLVKG